MGDLVCRVEELKRSLRNEVQLFCNRKDIMWKRPIVDTIHEFHDVEWSSVFFGGTLRSLLWSRLKLAKPGRPRDIDIVVDGADMATLRQRFERSIERENRFGGLKLRRQRWEFDVWPVQKTWMFLEDTNLSASFENLPYTTAFNLEAIAVEVWPKPGHARSIFAGDDQFFRGLLDEVLEINRWENPFPSLTVMRALLMAPRLDFGLGPRLCEYIADHGPGISDEEWETVQRKHYGMLIESPKIMRELTTMVIHARREGMQFPKLPTVKQLGIFEDAMRWPRPHVPHWTDAHQNVRPDDLVASM